MFGLINRDSLDPTTLDEFEHLTARLKSLWLAEHKEDGTHVIATPTTVIPVGLGPLPWPTDTAPSKWLLCRGQQVSRLTYKSLFDVIGTLYGAGDGSTTFNVPDVQQRFPLGKAVSGTGSTLAGTGGAIDHTHSDGTFATTTGGTGTGSTFGGDTGTGTTGTGTTGTGTTGTGTTGDAAGGFQYGTADFGLPGPGHNHSIPGLSIPGLSVPGLSVPSLSVPGLSIPSLSIPSLDVTGATGTNNPPFIVVNFIIFAGV